MKTYNEVIAAANVTIKNVSNNLRDGNKEFTSISSVLKFMQQKQFMKYYSDVFVACGVPVGAKITPKQFFDVTVDEQWGQTLNKKGEVVGEAWVGIWGKRQVVIDGVKQFEDDGVTPIVEDVLRKVTAWTPTKVFRVLAQAQAFKA